MPEKVEMGFWDHLVELLKRLRMMLYSVIVSTIIVMVFPITLEFSDFSASNPFYPTITSYVIKDFQQRFLPTDAQLLPLSPIAPLEVYMFTSVIIGLAISSPVISYEFYKFLNPALHTRERRTIVQFVGSFVGLFVFGFALAYLLVVPVTMRTLFTFSRMLGLPPVYDFTEFMSVIGLSLLICGLVFTFPTYIILLVKVGILKIGQLTKNRKYLYGGILIIIAFVDPEPGLVTEALLFIPIVILMESTILIAKRIEKRREIAAASS